MRCRGDLWSPVYDYCKLLFNDIIRISKFMRQRLNKLTMKFYIWKERLKWIIKLQ